MNGWIMYVTHVIVYMHLNTRIHRCVAVCCSVLQCVSVCCSRVMQSVAAQCSGVQCAGVC